MTIDRKWKELPWGRWGTATAVETTYVQPKQYLDRAVDRDTYCS